MDPAILTKLIAPFLPFLLNLGNEAPETVTLSASEKFGEAAWQGARVLWTVLGPKIEAKEAANEAVIDVANNPEDGDSLAALRLQLKKILWQDEEFASEIAEILAKITSDEVPRNKINQTVTGNQNQVIGQVSGGTIIFGSVEGNVTLN